MNQKQSQILTQVTSIAMEDEKNGTKTEIPSAEELVAKASISMHRSRQELINILGNLSKKATLRVLNAIFELPQDKLPVMLKTPEEKLAFVLGQRIYSDRFLIIQHHINKEIENRKAVQQSTNEEVTNG